MSLLQKQKVRGGCDNVLESPLPHSGLRVEASTLKGPSGQAKVYLDVASVFSGVGILFLNLLLTPVSREQNRTPSWVVAPRTV